MTPRARRAVNWLAIFAGVPAGLMAMGQVVNLSFQNERLATDTRAFKADKAWDDSLRTLIFADLAELKQVRINARTWDKRQDRDIEILFAVSGKKASRQREIAETTQTDYLPVIGPPTPKGYLLKSFGNALLWGPRRLGALFGIGG